MKLNQSGSSQIFLCLLLLMSLSGITAITFNKLTYYQKSKIRIKTLMCLRKSHYYQSDFTYDINLINRFIQVAFYASKVPIPQVRIPAKISLNILKIKQQIDLLLYAKNIYEIEECSKVTKTNILLNLIYKMRAKVLFSRNIDQTTKLVPSKKSNYIYFTNEKFSFDTPPLILKSSLKLDNRFDKKVKVFTKAYEI